MTGLGYGGGAAGIGPMTKVFDPFGPRPAGPSASTPAGPNTGGNLPTSVLNALGQSAPNQVPAINNTAAANPQAQAANDALMKRAQGDMGAADAMRLSTVGIRDAASGMMKELAGNRSRRGVSGTGVDSIQDAAVAGNALRQISGANSRIAFDSERAKDQQYTNVRGGALDQDSSNRADRRLALDQYDSANQAALAQQRLQQEKLISVLNLLRPGGGMF